MAARFGNTGYVADTVPLALTAAVHLRDLGFSPMLCEIIRCGGDTDTAGSIFGQIAGAYLGTVGVPGDLVQRFEDRDLVMGIAESLVAALGR